LFKSIKYLLFLAVACLLLMEIALRVHNPIYVPIRSDNIQLPVNRVFTQRNTNNPKVDEFQTYQFNSIGLRGPELPADPQNFTKIFTVGGSTTACVELTDGRTWPDQLFQRLQNMSDSVWLNNAGQNGHSTFGHLIMLDQHLKKFQPDFVIYLVGINDVARDDLNSYDAKMIGKGDTMLGKLVTSSELLSTAQVIKRSILAYDLGVNSFAPLDFESLPEVTASESDIERELALHKGTHTDRYRSRLEELVQRTRDAGGEPVLVTQPALYGRGIDPATGIRLDDLETPRQGLPGHVEWQVLELYNDVTRSVANDYNLLLVDLAVLLPKDSAYYFDWIHYSNAGAERVAEIMAEELRKSSLISLTEKSASLNVTPKG